MIGEWDWGVKMYKDIAENTWIRVKTLSSIYATVRMKLIDNMDEICINGKFSVQEPSEWRVFFA